MNLARLLVVAPHPDDDTIGCGGLISQTARAGGIVRVVYVSDGCMSHPGSVRYPPRALAELREAEARASLAVLGVREEPVFMRLRDGSLPSLSAFEEGDAVSRIASEIDRFEPEVVLGPWLRDPHPDHVATARFARAANAQASHRALFACYEVWLAIRGGASDRPQTGEAIAIDVPLCAGARARKRRALFEHRTQTGLVDDDPKGFTIDAALAERWLGASERLYVLDAHGYESEHAHRFQTSGAAAS